MEQRKQRTAVLRPTVEEGGRATTLKPRARQTASRTGLARPAAYCLLLAAWWCLLAVVPARAQYGRPPESKLPQGGKPEALKEVKIEQRLNNQVPLDIAFRDETGRPVQLSEYFKAGKPVVLSLVYYECPMLCNQVLNGQVSMMGVLNFDAGKEYTAVTVSFDPRETPALAASKKQTYLKRYGREGTAAGWHFLTGEQPSIDRLTEAVGFQYAWDTDSNQFAHASAIMVLTPEGRLSHYFYGIEYAPKDVRLSLVEASAGGIGSAADQLLLYCYHYDPTTGRFKPVMAVIRAAGGLTVLGLGALLFVLMRRGGGGGKDDDHWDESVNAGGGVA